MLRRLSLVLFVVALAGCSQGAVTTTTAVVVTSGTEAPPADTTSSTTSSTAPTTSTTVPRPELQGLTYAVVAEGLDFPIILMPWTADASLVGFRDGRVHAFDGETISAEPLFDLEVSTDGERGLLGLDTVDAGSVYVHYSDPAGDTVVSEITVSTGAERVLLTVSQPAANHNGGMLQFGPDGRLFLGLGDGGGSNDRFGHGQNTDTLLGGIVAIDPESGDSRLWSYGLRNPYRFWFDGEVLYIGDVGQGSYEEVDVVVFAQEGFNFGWPITEALHCFSPRTGCDMDGITLPLVEVPHGDAGTCSITGGVVYRGASIPELDGHYFYSDFCGGWLRSLRFDGSDVTDQKDWTDQVGVAGNVVSFGVDHDGEIYVLTPDAIRTIAPLRR
ncbi:MAG: PQQ-dependent sugar dehydrogenase [Acidimicrobiia bacterium]